MPPALVVERSVTIGGNLIDNAGLAFGLRLVSVVTLPVAMTVARATYPLVQIGQRGSLNLLALRLIGPHIVWGASRRLWSFFF